MRELSPLRPRNDESGFTLIEMVVAMALTLIVLLLLPAILSTTTTATSTSEGTTTGAEDAQLAIQNLDAQVASASQVCLPTPALVGESITLPSGTYTITGVTNATTITLSAVVAAASGLSWSLTSPYQLTTLSGTDGVTNGTNVFTAASGDFYDGFSLRVEQVESQTTDQWEQWQVNTTTGLLQEEHYTPGNAGNGWVTIAKTIYNSTIVPFTEPLAAKGSPQELLIDLQVSEHPGRLSEKLEIKSAVSAFSTPYVLSPTPLCSTTAAAPTS